MANPWFRLYSEFEDDPKVQMMSEMDQRRLIMLFCQRCKGERRTDQQLSFKWRVSLNEVKRTKTVFLANGFIDENWHVTNWNKRQFLSDSSTDRVRKFRERKNTTLKQDETLLKQASGVTVTVQSQSQSQNRIDTEQNRTDSDSTLLAAAQADLLNKRSARQNSIPASLSSIFSDLTRPRPSPNLPRTVPEMLAKGYRFSNKAACKDCGVEIDWWTSPKGARLPMDSGTALVHMETCGGANGKVH